MTVPSLDGLGDRCKSFEQAEAGRAAMPGIPLLARLDGRSFSGFARGLARPYDERMSRCMIETTRHLVQHTHALVGYTQSDEISLAWHHQDIGSELLFGGKFQKLTSVLAGMASARFCQLIAERIPEKASRTPHFDCRVWQVPTVQDAADVFIWREDDATKNSVDMAARSVYSDHNLFRRCTSTKHDMLIDKGINWNDYPAFFKRGSYLQRRTRPRTLTSEERTRIPEKHRPEPGATFERTEIVEIDMPPVRRVTNLLEALFVGAEPQTAADEQRLA